MISTIGFKKHLFSQSHFRRRSSKSLFIDLDFLLFLGFSGQIFNLSEQFFFLFQLLVKGQSNENDEHSRYQSERGVGCDTVKEFVGVLDGIPTDTIATADTVKNQGNFIPFLGSLFPKYQLLKACKPASCRDFLTGSGMRSPF